MIPRPSLPRTLSFDVPIMEIGPSVLVMQEFREYGGHFVVTTIGTRPIHYLFRTLSFDVSIVKIRPSVGVEQHFSEYGGHFIVTTFGTPDPSIPFPEH